MKVIRKNTKEDFKLLLSLGSKYNGEDFILTFKSGKYGLRSYVCSFIDGTYTNCEMADPTHVLCLMDNHNLPCGLLSVSVEVRLPDSQMPDGDFKVSDSRLVEAIDEDNHPFHIELSQGKSDNIGTPEAIWNLLGTVLKGDKGDPGKDFPEAPNDGKIYGRKAGKWVEAADEKLTKDVKQLTDHIQIKDDDVTIVTNGKLNVQQRSTGMTIDIGEVTNQVKNIYDTILPTQDGINKDLANRVKNASIIDGKLALEMPDGSTVRFGLNDMESTTFRIEQHMNTSADYSSEVDDYQTKPKTYNGRTLETVGKAWRGNPTNLFEAYYYDLETGLVFKYIYSETVQGGIDWSPLPFSETEQPRSNSVTKTLKYGGSVKFSDLDKEIATQFGLDSDLSNMSETGAKAISDVVFDTVGDFDDLETEAKDNLVDAINEAATSSSAIDITPILEHGSLPYPVTELAKHPLYTGNTMANSPAHIIITSHLAWLYVEYGQEMYAEGRTTIKRDIYSISIEDDKTAYLAGPIAVEVGGTDESIVEQLSELSLKVEGLKVQDVELHDDVLLFTKTDGTKYNVPVMGAKTEKVVISLSNNFGIVDWYGKSVTIAEHGESGRTYSLLLDHNGMAVAYVVFGMEYTVTFPEIEDYAGSEPMTFVAEQYVRDVSVRYKKVYHDLRDVARSFVVETSSSSRCELTGSEEVIDRILSHGSYVIDETNKKYARLSETDSNVFEDGTAWNGVYGNAFRYLPPVYVLHDKDYADAGQKYWVSDEPIGDVAPLPESWVGMYKGSVIGGVLRSVPGVMTTENLTMTQFWNNAQRVGTDYGLVNYFDHQKLNALHLVKYGDMNSDNTVGIGLRDAGASYYNHKTGTTASLGNGTGNAPYLSTSFNMVRLFGIEDLFGTTWEFRPNIRFDAGTAIIYEGNIVSNTAPAVRTFARLQTATQAYIKNMALGDNFDLVAINASGGSATTYWCDGTWAAALGQLLLVGGSSNSGSVCGLSCSSSDDVFSIAAAYVGARLAFRGRIDDYELVSGETLAALHS